jgi:signal transduction histidine kinase
MTDRAADELRSVNRELAEKNLELSQALEERDRLMQELVEAEKQMAIGKLVAGFAHELNTPIGIAVTAASNLGRSVAQLRALLSRDEIDEDELERVNHSLQTAAELVQSNLQRASVLIGGLKRVSATSGGERKERFSVLEVIRNTVVTLQPALREHGVALELRGEEDTELVNAPSALSQVITNIVLNAVKHAYPAGQRFEEKRMVIETWRDGDRFYLIEIRDFGKGIAPEHLKRIFDPFESTQGGSGLGLTIAENVVRGLFGGTITCDSALGAGTTFYVRLPVSAGAGESLR